MRIINLAHGSLAILSAFALFVLADRFDVSPFLGLARRRSGDGAGRLGAAARACWSAARAAGLLVPVLSTFGLSIIIDNLLFEQFGADTRSLAPYIGDLVLRQLGDDRRHRDRQARGADLGDGDRSARRHPDLPRAHTQLGRMIRATAEDPDTVGLVGVNARRVNAIAAAIAMATVAISGAFLAMRATFDPYAGAMQLIFAFEATVIGGAGSLWGTLLGGDRARRRAEPGRLGQPARLLPRRPLGVSRRAVRAAVLRRLRPARCGAPRCGRPAMSAQSAIPRRALDARIARRARRRGAASSSRSALGPPMFDANVVDRLTTLFIYVILAVTWNALVGYCGLVSIGQQAFFGLGAYVAVRLADSGLQRLSRAVRRRADRRRRCRVPLSSIMLRLKGGEFAIGMWVVAETRASPRQSRHAGAGRDRHVADRAQRLRDRCAPRR